MPDRITRRLTLAIAATLATSAPLGHCGPLRHSAACDASGDRRLGHRRVTEGGVGLPPGRRDVRQGEAIFAEKCASCHGPHGEGKPMDQFVGGFGKVADMKPQKTVGSFWPYATTLFDYVRRAMPLNAPHVAHARRSLRGVGLCAVSQRHRAAGTALDQDNLAKIVMPNRDGFVSAYPSPSPRGKP